MSKPTRPSSASMPCDWFAGSWSECLVSDFHNPCPHIAHYSHAGHSSDSSLCSNINYLQLFPILVTVRRWGPQWLDNRVIVDNDNPQAMAYINNGTKRNPIAMHVMAAWDFWISVQHNSPRATALTAQTEATRPQIQSPWVFRSHLRSFVSLTVGPPQLSCLCTTCVSPALAIRRSQWKAFLRFFSEFGLAPIVASSWTVIRFVIHLSSYCKNWMIINYLSAINGLLRHFNHYVTFGLLLFLLHINDLPNCCKKLSFRIFADDTYAFYTNDKFNYLETVLNDELKLVFEYCVDTVMLL